ncbi:hypothetical protein [Brevundimonas aveniformis]|uniref:hypothetical protein n=1 Tax=Brevundimonas aveniformis TaxID=370977 RepID=UPI0003F5690A|nr:hypothetical protein [Brevundimonas aveniformis]
MPEMVDAAFASAHHRAVNEGRVLSNQVAYARGSDRHFAVQRGLADLVESIGGEAITMRIGPSGYPMPLVRMGKTIVAASITDTLDGLRRSRARAELASLNSAIEPYQPDLWPQEAEVMPDEFRFAMVLIAKPHRDEDPTLPAGVYFGVPTSSLRSWHFYDRVDAVRAMYDDAEWGELPEVPERRVPRLRGPVRNTGTED